MLLSLQENFDVEDFAKSARKDHLKQPFLLCLKNSVTEKPTSFFVIVDETFIHCGESAENAFKVLFSSFFLFKVKWPPYISSFEKRIKFFEEMIFKIKATITPTTDTFMVKLDALTCQIIGA